MTLARVIKIPPIPRPFIPSHQMLCRNVIARPVKWRPNDVLQAFALLFVLVKRASHFKCI